MELFGIARALLAGAIVLYVCTGWARFRGGPARAPTWRRLPLFAAVLAIVPAVVLSPGGPPAMGRGLHAEPAGGMPDAPCSVLSFIPSELHAGIRDGTNATPLDPYIQAALDRLSPDPADAWAAPRARTGGTLCFPAGDYLITTEVASDGDGVVLVGEGIATRLVLEDAGALRFGALDEYDPKRGPGARNPKHAGIRNMQIVAPAGHVAGALVRVPMSQNFVLDGVRIASSEANNPITGVFLSAFQYVDIRSVTILTNAYPIHLKSLAADPHYESHVRIAGSQLFLSGNVREGGNAALHVEMEAGATAPIRDFLMERTLLAAFTSDRGEADTIGLKVTNPNPSPALIGTIVGSMFEQAEVLVDAATYAPDDRSHINFIGVDFLGKRDVTWTGWKGNAYHSLPYFEGCTFTNMMDGIDQPDPTVGPANNAVGITGAMFSNVRAVRYNGVERPFMALPRFRSGGMARVVDGASIPHHLIATPARVRLTSGDPAYAVAVAGMDETSIRVGVRRLDGGADPGASVTVYWEAAL